MDQVMRSASATFLAAEAVLQAQAEPSAKHSLTCQVLSGGHTDLANMLLLRLTREATTC